MIDKILPTSESKYPVTLTSEQIEIINSTGDIRINAVAGSGKTTTIIEYAATRPKESSILYLAFNKSVKLEAVRKFTARGLSNVKVETAHSLAYKYIIPRYNYSVCSSGYKIHEVAELLQLRGNGERLTEYIIANHISKFVTYFCNSDKSKVQDLNYLDIVNDNKAKQFVKSFYKYIEDGTRLFLSKMDKGEIDITHDFYLKKFQLSTPQLNYDYILFDEGQDASAAMLDIFLKQMAVKVIVGDTHQQIYAWRHAVNSLSKTDFRTLHLSSSFRFTQEVADLAKDILNWKNKLFEFQSPTIIGKGKNTPEISKAIIARTNLGLLLKAIQYITDNRKIKKIYFEGNIHSYTYADDGASLYDVLNLYNNDHDRIRDKLLKSMKDIDELEEYVEKTEDAQLGMMVEIVREYGNEIPGIIRKLKALHIGDDKREEAEMIFSTVHRAKGMEYDILHLVNDFITEEKLEKIIKEGKENTDQPIDIAKWNEEINLLYVAVTRVKTKLHIPDTILPKDFPASPHIQLIKNRKEAGNEDIYKKNSQASKPADFRSKSRTTKSNDRQIKERAYTVAQKRESHKDAYKPWTAELDNELIQLFQSDNPLTDIAKHFGRTKGAIIFRLKKLGQYSE